MYLKAEYLVSYMFIMLCYCAILPPLAHRQVSSLIINGSYVSWLEQALPEGDTSPNSSSSLIRAPTPICNCMCPSQHYQV